MVKEGNRLGEESRKHESYEDQLMKLGQFSLEEALRGPHLSLQLPKKSFWPEEG